MKIRNLGGSPAPTGTRPERLRHRIGRWIACVGATGLFSLVLFVLAVPTFHHECPRRPQANQSAAIATLRNIVAAQAQFQSTARLDRDCDGVGEFGYLTELAMPDEDGRGYLPIAFSRPTLLPEGGAVIERSGFMFQMLLPGVDGAWVPESSPVTAMPDTDGAEVRWCCLAWPSEYPSSGTRAFFVDESGEVLWTKNASPAHEGTTRPPAFDPIFVRGLPVDETRCPGQAWKKIHWIESGGWSYWPGEG